MSVLSAIKILVIYIIHREDNFCGDGGTGMGNNFSNWTYSFQPVELPKLLLKGQKKSLNKK